MNIHISFNEAEAFTPRIVFHIIFSHWAHWGCFNEAEAFTPRIVDGWGILAAEASHASMRPRLLHLG